MADSDYSRSIMDKLWGYIQSPHLSQKIRSKGKEKIEDSKKILREHLDSFKKENSRLLKEKRVSEFVKGIEAMIEELNTYLD
jgi:hypothetical protein